MNRRAAWGSTLAAAVTAAATAAYVAGVRPWLLRWGATDAEARELLPGDDLVRQPKLRITRAITINAPVAQVWPWLAQMGQDRGGLYSYDWLENVFGLDFHNASRIHPEWQDVKVGDKVWLAPHDRDQMEVFLEVVIAEPERALVLHTAGDPAESMANGFPDWSWAFVLRPLDPHTTRLLVRSRSDHAPTVRGALANRYLLEPLHFIMERKMLLGIRERAEGVHAPDGPRTLLDDVLPEYEFQGAVSVRVAATPAQVFQALRAVTLADMPLAAALGQVRYLPARLAGRLKSNWHAEPFLSQLLRDRGNIILAEEPDREMVIGAIGKFHDLIDQQPVALHRPDEFAAFNDPAYQKLAMAFRIEGGDTGDGCTVTLEHRTHALSDAARRDFAWYWLLIKPASAALSFLLLRAVKARAERLARGGSAGAPQPIGTLGTGGNAMSGRERLEALLQEQDISYKVIEHPLTLTAQHTAEIEHVPGRKMMKVVMLEAEGRPVMAVVAAPAHVHTEKVAAQLGVKHARITHEDEFAGLFPDCETGAMPPFGNLYGVPVYVDAGFVEQDDVVFPAASHTASIAMKFHDYQRLVRPVVADLIVVEHPAEAR